MRRTLTGLMLGLALAVATAAAADAIRHGTLAPIWEMAWLPAIVAGAPSMPAGRRCRRRP